MALLALALLLAPGAEAFRLRLGLREDLCDVQVDALDCHRERWLAAQRALPAAQRDIALEALAVGGGRVFTAVPSTIGPGSTEFLTLAHDAARGTKLWEARYRGPATGPQDRPAALVASPDGARVFVTGPSTGGLDDDFATIAYDATSGARLWEARLHVGQDTPYAVATNGPLVVAAGSAGEDLAVVAYDARDGTERWRFVDAGPGPDAAAKVAPSPDGARFFVTGASANGVGRFEYLTLALDAATGQALWSARNRGSWPQDGTPTDLAVARDGSAVYVTGVAGPGYFTIAYDAATGGTLWHDRDPTGDIEGDESAQHPPHLALAGSKVLVAGRGFDAPLTSFLLVAHDAATGAKLWSARYAGPLQRSEGRAVAASPSGHRAYVTGPSFGATANVEVTTVAFDTAGGAQAWVARLDRRPNSDAFPSAIATGPDGHVYVAATVPEEPPLGSSETAWLAAVTASYAP